MQEGSFRCDANVSVRPMGQTEFGTRCEIKNLNSFRFLEEAIQYEVRRQIELIEDGGRVIQETRLYDPDLQETRSMRSKEDAQDYRYFPDPDLLPLVIHSDWIEEIRAGMPALPATLCAQWQSEYGLSSYDSQILSQDRATADLLMELVRRLGVKHAKTIANFIAGDLASALNRSNLSAHELPIGITQIEALLNRSLDGTISNKIAKEIFILIWEDALANKPAILIDEIIEQRGLKQITDIGALEALVDEVLQANTKSVEEFKSGKEKAFNALIGQVMKASQGKANPQQLNEILRKKLQSG
jgi:aspartyl-tRNA(Asn)/glutamyl-tRNA(Gln) amidotransferase subunit B